MREFITDGDELFYNPVASALALWDMAQELGPDDPCYEGLVLAANSFVVLIESHRDRQQALLN